MMGIKFLIKVKISTVHSSTAINMVLPGRGPLFATPAWHGRYRSLGVPGGLVLYDGLLLRPFVHSPPLGEWMTLQATLILNAGPGHVTALPRLKVVNSQCNVLLIVTRWVIKSVRKARSVNESQLQTPQLPRQSDGPRPLPRY